MTRRSAPPRLASTYIVLALLAVAATAASLGVGAIDLRDPALRSTILALRGARLAGAFLAGAALATGGVVAQGLFRNPLVSPSILGTTSGASLGGQLVLIATGLAGPALPARLAPEMLVPLGCLAGALVSLAILLVAARAWSGPLVFLFVGFILSSIFLAAGGLVTSLAQDSWELGRAVVAFTLGGLGGVGARQVLLAAPLVVAGIVAAWLWSRSLDLFLSGEEEAASLGADVPIVRRWCVVWVAVLTAGAVCIGGNVGFVGLIVPHALRPFLGTNHRRLLPAAGLAGGTFLAACDLIARVVPSRGEVPLGVVTGLVGGPLFLALVLRARRELAHG